MHLGGLRTAALSALLLASVSGCGGSSNSGTGKISVHLMDAPGDYLEVNVDVQEVQINGPNGWESLPTKAGVINLLDFQNGFTTTLVNEFGIEAGHYTQLRLLLGSDNTIVTEGEGGARVSSPLKVPSGMQSGIKLNVNFDVEPGTTKDVFIDFDAHRSVFVHGAGASGQYILRPVVFCYDKLITGSISGTVTDTATGQPLVGAGVSAQTIGADGIPSVLRSTETDAAGHYVLAHLWIGQPVHVVTQPVIGDKVYAAFATPALTVTEAAPVLVQDIGVTVAPQVGGITGKVLPLDPETTGDEVIALQGFVFGGTSVKLRIRSVNANLADGSYALPSLPAGAYGLYVTRTIHDAVTGDATGSSAPVDVNVTAGAPVTKDLTAPTLP